MDSSLPGSSVHGVSGKNTGEGCHFLLQGDLPNPGIEPGSLVAPALAGGFFTTEHREPIFQGINAMNKRAEGQRSGTRVWGT